MRGAAGGRGFASWGLALLGVAAAPLVGSCRRGGACESGACTTGTSVTARLAVARATLDAASIEVCKNGACSTRGAAVASGLPGSSAGFALSGALAGHGTIETLDAGTCRVTFTLEDANGSGADGDRYALTVKDPSGATLYAVERGVLYDHPPVAEGCPARCPEAALRFYPTSASGLTCAAHACKAGLIVHGTTRVARHDLEGAVLHACRNGTCAGVTLTAPLPASPNDQAAFVVHSVLDARVIVSFSADASFGITVMIDGDTADLADGDVYQIELMNPGGGHILGFTTPVTYTETFPDGAECDVLPCRTAEGALSE